MFVCQHPGIVFPGMRKVLFPVLLASALALAAFSAPVMAQTDSAVDEYQESIPGAGGGPSSNEGGQGGGSGGGSDSATGPVGGGASLAPEVADELADEGSAGTALGDFTEETGTAPASATKAASDGPVEGSSSSTGPAPSGSDDEGFLGALGDVLGNFLLGSGSDSDSGSSGLGVFFPIVLIGALAGTAALLIARRRRGPAEPHQG
jgi:hypothetical protein